MDCHFRDLPDFQSSEARLMTASAVHKLSEYCVQLSMYCLTRITIEFSDKDLQSRHIIGTEILCSWLNAGMCWRMCC